MQNISSTLTKPLSSVILGSESKAWSSADSFQPSQAFDPFETAAGPLPLTEAEESWRQVLDRLALANPASIYAQMTDKAMVITAKAWRAELPDVPPEAVPELYRRTMNARTHTFPLSIDDFRIAWGKWDYFAELNTVNESAEAVMLALPEAPPDPTAHGITVYRNQATIKEKFGQFVCCHCIGKWGRRNTATQTMNKKTWICHDGICDFVCTVGAEREHFENEAKTPPPLLKFEPVVSGHVTTRRPSVAFMAWTACGFHPDNYEAQTAEDAAHFAAWAKWFKERYPTTAFSHENLETTWNAWVEEHNAKVEVVANGG